MVTEHVLYGVPETTTPHQISAKLDHREASSITD